MNVGRCFSNGSLMFFCDATRYSNIIETIVKYYEICFWKCFILIEVVICQF